MRTLRDAADRRDEMYTQPGERLLVTNAVLASLSRAETSE